MTSKTRIYLVRHGEIAGDGIFRYNGQIDVPLTPKGVEQYHHLAGRLKDHQVSACYSSDLSRCMEGAEILCRALDIRPTGKRELRELSFGSWEGMTWAELAEKFPHEWNERLRDVTGYRPPGGENLSDLRQRVMPLIREIAERHQGKEALVVGHGGVNRIILLDAIGAPQSSMFRIEQEFGCLNIIDYYADGNPVVALLNG
jgi:alpha-ribazole phosphatase